MYFILMLICATVAVSLIWYGRVKNHRLAGVAGVVIGIAALAVFSLLDFWGEYLWFQALNYSDRFWTAITPMLGLSLAGCLFGLGVTWALSLLMPPGNSLARYGTRFFGAFIGIFWGYTHWETWLKYFHGVGTQATDPFFSKDAGFYLFALPWFDALHQLLFMIGVIMLIGGIIQFLQVQSSSLEIREIQDNKQQDRQFKALFAYAALFLVILAYGIFLERYHLLYSEIGVVHGPGWTDVHIRLPMYWVDLIFYLLLAAVLMFKFFLDPIRNRFRSRGLGETQSRLAVLASAGVLVLAVLFLTQSLIPKTFQWLRVEPNEITFEEPYIKHNIEFTRQAFKLDQVEEREFQAAETFNSAMVERNQNIFSNIRLWDWRALDSVYKQFQEIRLYYEFNDVDIDRYTFADAYREVMVSAREMEINNLPEQSQTFVNRRFKYTHGYGITMNNVSEFTPQGLPNLLIRDIPPKSSYPELKVERPEIYYGELTQSPAVVNTGEEEFDYPKGEQNAYIHYPNTGGVPLTSIWRKFIYGWMYDGTRFFLSNYPNQESRFMFHRQIRERVQTLAPFLEFDQDPHIVMANGRLYWIIDAYTTSEKYPYSENFSAQTFKLPSKRQARQMPRALDRNQLMGMNYLRNSVKAVVNAFSREVDFYIFDKADPLIRTWDNIFPGLFQAREAMPEALQAHVRYPDQMLLVQGMVYAK